MNDLKEQLEGLTEQQRQELLARLLKKKERQIKRFALSFAQQRLWVLHKMDSESPAYNVPTALRLQGPLDIKTLERCFGEVVRRHEALRTTFEANPVEGHPEQVIHPWKPFNIEVIDLRGEPSDDRLKQARSLANQHAQRPFNLSSGPLFRVALISLDDDDFVLLLTIHHIVSDMWSTQVLTRELITLYEAYSRGDESPLPDLPIQYADFAHWQRNRLKGDALERQLLYWRDHLSGPLPVIELPTRGPRPYRHSVNGAEMKWRLDPQTTEKLKLLSQQEGATLFMSLLAAFKVLLSRYTSQLDILVGTPIANRNRAEIEPLIGLFINTLVLRSDLSLDPTFKQLLAKVKEIALGAYANQDLPFEKLVEELQPERDLARTPLFQVMFALQNVPQQNGEAFSLSVSPFEYDARTSKFDLTLTALEDEQGLLGVCEYNTDLFDRSMIEQLIRHYKTLLANIPASAGERISRLSMLEETERLELLNQPHESFEKGFIQNSIHELFEAQVERSPEAVALVCEDAQLTYDALNRRANKLARYLRSRGTRPDRLVGIFVERSIEMVVGLLGILKAGGAYVPLDPAFPPDRLTFIVKDADIKILLTERRMLESLSDHKAETVCLDADWERIELESDANSESEIAIENLAYVIYTSGSTGQPKGALVTHANVLRLFSSTQKWFGFGADDVWTLFHSYAFDFSVWEIWGALLFGGRLLSVPYMVSRSPELFYEMLTARKVTVLNQTPSAFRQLMQVDEERVAQRSLALRLVIFGGEALDIPALKPWFERHGDQSPRLVNMYGITETTVHVTYRPLVKEDAIRNAGSLIGLPISDLRFYILDRNLEPVPFHVAGEIYVGGAGLSRGYLNRPELTAERFIQDPFSPIAGARLYKTGDSARRLASGEVEYLGRVDLQVKIRGFRIELGEIEAALLDHPAIRNAVVVATDSASSDKQLIAYVVPDAQQSLNTPELRVFLKKRLPDYMIPAHFISMDALPLTPNGKIDRKALPDPQASRPNLSAALAPARTPTERLLADIWAGTLQIETVGIDDNFFELGGDSIRSIQMISKAQKHNINLSFADVFEYQTIRELAQELGSRRERAGEPALEPVALISESDRRKLPMTAEDAYPLTMLQAGMLFHSALDPAAAVYHNVGSYHLRVPFDAESLRLSIERLLMRHPVLRTSFDLTNFSEPMQVVHVAARLLFEVEDLRELSAIEQEEAIHEWIESEKRSPFDSDCAPLIRFHAHRRTNDTFQFGLTEHHAILDGWSVASALTELFQTYVSLLRCEPQPAEVPRANLFRDFVILERKALASEQCRKFWSDKLSDCSITLLPRLPCADSSTEAATAHAVDVAISPEVSEALKQVAAMAQVPLKSVLLSAHLKVLSLLSGQPDVMTGVVMHGRPEGADSARSLGLFLNTVPFRQTLGRGTWTKLANETFNTEREIVPFRFYPMAQIQRDLGGEPLFETVFNFTHFHVFQELERLGELEALDSSLFAQTNLAFWANFSMSAFSPIVQLTLSADQSQFNKQRLETIGGYYARALESIAFEPNQEYFCCDLLSEKERTNLLVERNDTSANYPQTDCVNQLFEAQVERSPDAVAIVSGSEQVTFRELNRRANQLARHLRLLDLGPEIRVGVCLRRSANLVVGLMGIVKAGGAYVPLDIAYPQQRIEFMMADAGVSIIVTEQSMIERLQSTARKLICLDADWAEISLQNSLNPERYVSAHNLAYVIYTSGSTGTPKGVAIEHQSAVAFLNWACDIFSIEDVAGTLASTSICFDLSVFELFFPLIRGGKIILVENALDLSEAETSNVTLINTVPSAMAELIRMDAIPQSVTTVNLAGEPLRNRLAQQVYQQSNVERVFNLYGPSEDTTYSTFALIRKEARDEPTIGRTISNTRAFALDANLQLSPAGVAGEFHLGGAGLARGYLNQAALTAEKFIPDPYSNMPGARLYKTGDLARPLPDGDIEFLGRLDHQIKIRGFRIELGEIDAILSEHPLIREAVTLVSSSADDKRIVAYVVSNTETHLAADRLSGYLRERLPDHMIPSAFVFMDALPLTPNGKIDRRALSRIEISADYSKRIIVAPRDLLEFQLVQIWENLLNIRPISVTDNFFELGGHSLLAVRLAAKVREKLNRTLPLSALARGANIESLASLLRQQTGAKQDSASQDFPLQDSPLVAIQPEGSKSPFFCVHPIGGNILCYIDLARSIGSDRPFYGLQAAGLNAGNNGRVRIEDMATQHIEAIRAVQPTGPYLLGGWSFGGVVAFEMARQLKEQSGQTSHLALIDTWAPAMSPMPIENRLGVSDLVARFFADIAGLSGKDLSADCERLQHLDKQEQLSLVLEQAIGQGLLPADMKLAQIAHLFDIFERNASAFQAYTPASLNPAGRIILFRASDGKNEALDDATLGWDKFILERLEVRNVSGNHYTMLANSNAGQLAEQLKAYLDSIGD